MGGIDEDEEELHQDWLSSQLNDKYFGSWWHNAGIIFFCCFLCWVLGRSVLDLLGSSSFLLYPPHTIARVSREFVNVSAMIFTETIQAEIGDGFRVY